MVDALKVASADNSMYGGVTDETALTSMDDIHTYTYISSLVPPKNTNTSISDYTVELLHRLLVRMHNRMRMSLPS